MTTYNPVSPEFLAEVEAVIGKENVFTDPEKLDMYKTDEEYDPRRFRVPEAVVRPGTPEEIAAIVKLFVKDGKPLKLAKNKPVISSESDTLLKIMRPKATTY